MPSFMNVNTISEDKQWSGLTIAAYNNCHQILEWLLRQPGIDVNTKTVANQYFGKKWTALMFACRAGNSEIVSRLSEVPNIDFNYRDKDGCAAVHCAARYNNIY